MRVPVDTNVVISALLFPRSAPGEVLAHVLAGERLALTQWIIDELHEVVSRKRPDLLPALDTLLASIEYELAEPDQPDSEGLAIADVDDQPILDAALAADVDVIVTGDKHFLVLDVDRPQIMTPRAFLDSRTP
ncbi:putative toxin-antitoxin system toxin component, PIN family [Aeromicrobium sp. PE09-221]|nr:putative toxin-antitoxin system toxin component, PIN family [Aeromicrobium sp. PE09-221]